MHRGVRWLLRTVRRLLADQRGNAAVIFGFAVMPLVAATGLAVDTVLAYNAEASSRSRWTRPASPLAVPLNKRISSPTPARSSIRTLPVPRGSPRSPTSTSIPATTAAASP
jgi:hypothetical protein